MKAENLEVRGNTLKYWEANAKENFAETPISVLKYITILEEAIETFARIQIEKDREDVIENTPLIDRLKLIKTYSNTPITLD